ncbi:unnamed protein product [Calypogeia fissa]
MATVTELPGGTSTDTAPPTGDSAGKEKGDNWRFIEPQPIREDQVENAVKFLSHPKVKGSPVVYRRSFLERKGLSREEIDEAFRRVPDPPSDSSPSTVQVAGPVGTVSSPTSGTQISKPGAQLSSVQEAPKSASWTQILLALGVLSAAGAGAGVLTKKYFIPKLKEWILDIVSGKSSNADPNKASKPTPAQEAATAAAAAAAAAATAATQMAAAMQEIAKSKSEDRRSLDSIIRAVEAQTKELKSTLTGMKDIVQNLEVTKYQRPVTNSLHSNGVGIEDSPEGQTNGGRLTSVSEGRSITTKQTNFGVAPDSSTRIYSSAQQVKPISSSPSNGSLNAPHSQSYLDVIAMLERGEKPPGIREVNDKPPNPNQQPSNPRLQPRLKPWEKAALDAQSSNPGAGDETIQPLRYNESWPVVNTDLTMGAGTSSSSEPWWRKKGDTDGGLGSSAVKITEVVATEVDIGTVRQSSSSSYSFQSGGGRAGWVPPAVPLPVYPGAEEAIRRPKPTTGMSSRIPGESMSAASSSSSFQKEDSPSRAEVLADSIQSNGELPEQRVEVPDEQEPEYLDRSLVDSTRTFKDVVQEEGDQQ